MINKINNIEKYDINELIIIVIVFIIAISKMPLLKNIENILKNLGLILILITIGKSIIQYKIQIKKKEFKLILLILCINILIISIHFLSDKNYISSQHFYALNLSLLILILGYLSKVKKENSIKRILIVYSFAILIICMNLIIENFIGINVISLEMYVVSTKNQHGAMIVSSLIILFIYYFNEKSLIRKIGFICIFTVNFITLILIQNRSGILSILICISIYYIRLLMSKEKKITKRGALKLILGIFIMVTILILVFPKLAILLRWSFDFDKLTNNGIEGFSSGRIFYFKQSIRIFGKNIFYGVGNYYVDNFWLCILAQYGIIISSLILIYILSIIKNIWVCFFISKNVYNLIGIYFTIVMIIVSMMEAIAPLGPGTSYYIYWLLFGFILNQNKKCKS